MLQVREKVLTKFGKIWEIFIFSIIIMMMVINSQDEVLYVTNTQRKWTTKICAFSFGFGVNPPPPWPLRRLSYRRLQFGPISPRITGDI
jgi:hypothetical protein